VSFLKIAVDDGFVFLDEVQASGKKQMKIKEFLRGFSLSENWSV